MKEPVNPHNAFAEVALMVCNAFAAWTIVKEVTAFLHYIFEQKNSEVAGIITVSTVYVSSQTLVYTALKELLDGRNDAHSIPKLLDSCESCGKHDVQQLLQSRTALESLRPTVRKIGILRGHIFGHRSVKHSIIDAYNLADLKPEEIDVVFENIRSVLEAASKWLGIKGFDDDFRDHGRTDIALGKMFEALSPGYLSHRDSAIVRAL